MINNEELRLKAYIYDDKEQKFKEKFEELEIFDKIKGYTYNESSFINIIG